MALVSAPGGKVFCFTQECTLTWDGLICSKACYPVSVYLPI